MKQKHLRPQLAAFALLVVGSWLASPAAAQWGWRGHMARRHAMHREMMLHFAPRVLVAPATPVPQPAVTPTAPRVTLHWGWSPAGVVYSWRLEPAVPAFEPQLGRYPGVAGDPNPPAPPGIASAEQSEPDEANPGLPSVLRPPVSDTPTITAPELSSPAGAGAEALPAPTGPIDF